MGEPTRHLIVNLKFWLTSFCLIEVVWSGTICVTESYLTSFLSNLSALKPSQSHWTLGWVLLRSQRTHRHLRRTCEQTWIRQSYRFQLHYFSNAQNLREGVAWFYSRQIFTIDYVVTFSLLGFEEGLFLLWNCYYLVHELNLWIGLYLLVLKGFLTLSLFLTTRYIESLKSIKGSTSSFDKRYRITCLYPDQRGDLN